MKATLTYQLREFPILMVPEVPTPSLQTPRLFLYVFLTTKQSLLQNYSVPDIIVEPSGNAGVG